MLDMTTVDKVKELLGVSNTDTKWDTILKQLISNVSAEAEIFMNRIALNTGVDRYEIFDVVRSQTLFRVSAYPVASVTDVRLDLDRVFGTTTIIASANYAVNSINGIIIFDAVILSPGPQVLKITYKGGMATSTLVFMSAFPHIASAVQMEVAYRFQRRNQIGLIASTIEGGSITTQQKGQFLPAVEAILETERRQL